MEEILKLLWHVPTVMVVLLVAGLLMGQRHVGELSVFDLLTGIAIGAVAGAGVVDPDLPHLPVLFVILALALLHWVFTWAVKRWPRLGRATTFEPVVVVQDGKPVGSAMSRIQLTLSDLLPLLREKEIFDIREVRYGVMEPDGKLTVIKSDYPSQKSLNPAVIVDGYVEERVLRSLGWDRARLLAELERQGHSEIDRIFLATLSEAGELYVVPRGDEPRPPLIRH
ncbi:MAG: DUF421 domain-containing protein [Bacillota bacterium]